ncbi:MAG: PDZ domain-containing protein [Cyanobacteria bacterium]|nr:PDZ domain-containing protein [Cyanobacteriota bacterium]
MSPVTYTSTLSTLKTILAKALGYFYLAFLINIVMGRGVWAEVNSRPITLNGFVQQSVSDPVMETDPALLEPIPDSGPGIVGLDLLIQPKQYPVIQGVFRGSPAALVGMQPQDFILEVDGISTLGKSKEQVDAQISDVPGQQVKFKVLRNGSIYQFQLKVISLYKAPSALRNLYASFSE